MLFLYARKENQTQNKGCCMMWDSRAYRMAGHFIVP